jgi:hypothetical protein
LYKVIYRARWRFVGRQSIKPRELTRR